MDGALQVAAISFACIVAGAIAGMVLRPHLPGHHLSKESLDVIKVSVGMIAAMSSLVLGLMTASVKGSFDLVDRQHRLYAARLMQLDDALRHYGPEAGDARSRLKRYVERIVAQSAATADNYRATIEDTTAGNLLEAVKDDIASLEFKTDAQHRFGAEATRLIDEIISIRWSLVEQAGGSIVPAFLIVLVCWLTIIFVSFGLMADTNATIIVALVLCAASIAGALFLIIEMDMPFNGVISVPFKPLADTLAHINR